MQMVWFRVSILVFFALGRNSVCVSLILFSLHKHRLKAASLNTLHDTTVHDDDDGGVYVG